MAKCAKKRTYSDDYLKGFTVISKNSLDMPQCVICFKILKILLGVDSYQKLSKISDSTVSFGLMKSQMKLKHKFWKRFDPRHFLPFSVDETTDVSNCSHLLVYARFIGTGILKEEMMLCCPLETTTKADDILAVVSKLFEENNLSWGKLVGVCTDGAPAI